LNLKAGEWVEVRGREEILATLDSQGRLENLPFMPEMLQYCGQKLRVFKRADKTCQYLQGWSIRRVKDVVHLEGVRCDGTGHGGCEAGCLIFWKERWLKRVAGIAVPVKDLSETDPSLGRTDGFCTVESILSASQARNSEGERVYTCQATDVNKFTSHMRSLDPRQYIRDLRSGNLATGLSDDSRSGRALELVLGLIRILQAVTISLFNRLQARRHGVVYPFIVGSLEKTPLEVLNLQAGELVQVKYKDEILATLDKQNCNRGLLFDSEMLAYCGGIYKVSRRVKKIIDEKTGKLIEMKYPCIVLEGVVCRSDYHRLCPRAIYSYWRESWLVRAAPGLLPAKPQQLDAESAGES